MKEPCCLGTKCEYVIMSSPMELREFFMHFRQVLSMPDQIDENKIPPQERLGYTGRRRRKWRRLLKRHWPYVLAVVGAIFLAMIISRIG